MISIYLIQIKINMKYLKTFENFSDSGLSFFINNWVDENIGLESATPNVTKDIIEISATPKARVGYQPTPEMVEEWKLTGDNLIEDLQKRDFGIYEITNVTGYNDRSGIFNS